MTLNGYTIDELTKVRVAVGRKAGTEQIYVLQRR